MAGADAGAGAAGGRGGLVGKRAGVSGRAGARAPKRARGAPRGRGARGGSGQELLKDTQEVLERVRSALARAQAVGGELCSIQSLARPKPAAMVAEALEIARSRDVPESPQPWLRPEAVPSRTPASTEYHADAAALHRLTVAMEVVARGGVSHRERFERGLRAMQEDVQRDWLAWKDTHPRTMASSLGVGIGPSRCI